MLEAMLAQFPFRIRGFHSDNGSEYINHTVAELLNKLLIEQTKSRPRHSNDNGLAESKNGAVVRKHMGYTHIATTHAEAIHGFYQEHLNPYLNFHRPCGVPELVVNGKGKEKRVYRWYATPWEILRQLPVARHLKADVPCMLDQQAPAKTDTQAAEEMQEAKSKLFAASSKSEHGERASRWSARANRRVLEPKPKPPLKEKPKRWKADHRLPLVGPGIKSESERSLAAGRFAPASRLILQ